MKQLKSLSDTYCCNASIFLLAYQDSSYVLKDLYRMRTYLIIDHISCVGIIVRVYFAADGRQRKNDRGEYLLYPHHVRRQYRHPAVIHY